MIRPRYYLRHPSSPTKISSKSMPCQVTVCKEVEEDAAHSLPAGMYKLQRAIFQSVMSQPLLRHNLYFKAPI